MYYSRKPYVPVAKRRDKTLKKMNQLRKKGVDIQPVETEGRKIAKTFWGDAWCKHIELFSDYSNRLPRGRTYVRNGSVCHLAMKKGGIEAIVSGSELYSITGTIKPLPTKDWKSIKEACTGQVGSMLELLQGKLSDNIMATVTNPEKGLFPQAKDMKISCDCPDWAGMCKHVAAVLYGVGARLDTAPELLFSLRSVDHHELISTDFAPSSSSSQGRRVKGDISDVFGINLDSYEKPLTPLKKRTETSKKQSATKSNTKKTAVKSEKSKNPPSFTAASVKRLRKELQMNKSQFASLLNISVASISNWEGAKGKLGLRESSRKALILAKNLSPDEAWRKIESA